MILLLLLLSGSLAAETRYVTDQFKVTLRGGESTQKKILRMLPSGTEVEVLEVNSESGYSHVQVGDLEGYVLTHELVSEPIARTQLQTLKDRIMELEQNPSKLRTELDELRQRYTQLEQTHQQLTESHIQLQKELESIHATAANAVRAKNELERYREQVAQLSGERDQLQQQLERIQQQTDQRWFMIGAGVIAIGVLIGLILPQLRFGRRKSSGGWGQL